QGQEYPFNLRLVEIGFDEDGEPETTMVLDWLPAGAAGAQAQPEAGPWRLSRRQNQRAAGLRLKTVVLGALKEPGGGFRVPPDGPVVRIVDQEIVRQQFYACTPTEGTPAQKTEFRRKRFNRAVDWAEDQLLIAVHEIGLVTYLRLSRPEETKENAGSELNEELEHVPSQLNQGDSLRAKDERVYRH